MGHISIGKHSGIIQHCSCRTQEKEYIETVWGTISKQPLPIDFQCFNSHNWRSTYDRFLWPPQIRLSSLWTEQALSAKKKRACRNRLHFLIPSWVHQIIKKIFLGGLFRPACLARVVSWFAIVVAIFMAHESGDKRGPAGGRRVRGCWMKQTL